MLEVGYELGSEEGQDDIRTHIGHGLTHHAGHVVVALDFPGRDPVGQPRQQEAEEEQGDDGGDPAREGAVIAGEGRVIGKMTSRVDHEEEQDQKDGEDRPSGFQAPAFPGGDFASQEVLLGKGRGSALIRTVPGVAWFHEPGGYSPADEGEKEGGDNHEPPVGGGGYRMIGFEDLGSL